MDNVKTIDQLIQEHEAAGGVVDRGGYQSNAAPSVPTVQNTHTRALAGYPVFNLSVPNISYTPPSMESLLLEAQQLYSGGYNRQMQAAQKTYNDALTDLQRTYAQNMQNVSDAATARGFGRSSYVTDALSQLGNYQGLAQERYGQALMQQVGNLNTDLENQISAYASQQYRAGQEKLLETELLKAQLQMELDQQRYNSDVQRLAFETEHPNIYKNGNNGNGSGSDKTVLHDPGLNVRPTVLATDNPSVTGPAIGQDDNIDYAPSKNSSSGTKKSSSSGSSGKSGTAIANDSSVLKYIYGLDGTRY